MELRSIILRVSGDGGAVSLSRMVVSFEGKMSMRTVHLLEGRSSFFAALVASWYIVERRLPRRISFD